MSRDNKINLKPADGPLPHYYIVAEGRLIDIDNVDITIDDVPISMYFNEDIIIAVVDSGKYVYVYTYSYHYNRLYMFVFTRG